MKRVIGVALVLLGGCEARQVALGNLFASVAVQTDLNRDGQLELAVSSELSSGIVVFSSPFAPDSSSGIELGTGVRSLLANDLSGDGFPEFICVTNANDSTQPQSNRVLVLPNNGDGTFGAPVELSGTESPLSVGIVDLDGDGDGDVVVGQSGEGSPDSVLMLRQDSGAFSVLGQFLLPPGEEARTLQTGDLNGDGTQDLYFGRKLSLYLNEGQGNFQLLELELLAGDLIGPSSLLGDFDRDGLLDILLNADSSRLSWRVARNTGDAIFELLPPVEVGIDAQSVSLGDFNADGLLDFGLILRSEKRLSDNFQFDFELVLYLNEAVGESFRGENIRSVGFDPIRIVSSLREEGRDSLLLSTSDNGDNQLLILGLR